jgi:hypothetical protein
VLHDASDNSHEEAQTIVLPGFVSRFRLEEREPEVATIDSVELTLSLKSSGTMILEPHTTGPVGIGRQVLFWGESRECEFQLPPNASPTDVVQSKLILTGYYERYSNLPNSAYRGEPTIYSDASFSTVLDVLRAQKAEPICPASSAAVRNVSTALPTLTNSAH